MAIDVEATYRRYGPMVLRRCRRLLRDEEKALDAMQDVFVQLVRHEERLDDRGLSSLLFRIATNTCLNRLRSQGRRPEDPAGDIVTEIAVLGAEQDERSTARALLGKLFAGTPESTATIAVLHLVDGMTLEEVAREVGMSVSGVRKRLRGLKEKLQALAPMEEVSHG